MVQSLFPGATVLLVLDSTPPQFDLSRAVVNSVADMALTDLDNASAVFNSIEARWGSPLLSAAVSVGGVWDQAVQMPCSFSTQCMLDNYIPTDVPTFVISPASDAWTVATHGINWVISGIENGEGPTVLNLRDRFYVMLQSLRVSFQTGVIDRGRDFPVGLFAPGCIHHGLLQPTRPHMPGNGINTFGETTISATVRVATGIEDIDFVLNLDVTDLYSSAGRSWTDLVVGGSNLEAALSAWVTAVRTGDRSPKIFADGCMGPSCNPTCLETMSFKTADHYKKNADGWVIATLTIGVIFLSISLSMKVWAHLNPFVDRVDEFQAVAVHEAAEMLIDQHEFRPKLKRVLRSADMNSSLPGLVTRADVHCVFHLLDSNDNGSLSRAEAIKAMREDDSIRKLLHLQDHVQQVRQEDGAHDAFDVVYQKLDVGHAGPISPQEFAAAFGFHETVDDTKRGSIYTDPTGITLEGPTRPGQDAAAVPGESSDVDANADDDADPAEGFVPLHTGSAMRKSGLEFETTAKSLYNPTKTPARQSDDIPMVDRIKKMSQVWAKTAKGLSAQRKRVADSHPSARSTLAPEPDPDGPDLRPGPDLRSRRRDTAPADVLAAQHDHAMAQSSRAHWLSELDGDLDSDTEDTGHLRVRNMSYVVPEVQIDGTKVQKVLQSGVYTHCRPGVTAIMGPSGAGKTTFLNVAAGRIVGGEVSGDVYFDELEVYATKGGRKKAQCMTGFVTQHGMPWEDGFTFRENLQYAAEMRMPDSTATKRAVRVETAIAAVEGREFSNVVTARLSGGQQRKLSMAIQLLSESTRFLFLDEPTSGLDSTSALSLLTLLKRLGRNGYTILITIHQPRIEVWELFDEVMVFGSGRVCFQGPPDAAVAFLSHVVQDTNGGLLERPEGSNPADVVIDFLKDPTHEKAVSAAYAATRAVRQMRKQIDEHCLALVGTRRIVHAKNTSFVDLVHNTVDSAMVGINCSEVRASLHRIYTIHRRMAHAGGLWLPSLLLYLSANLISLLYWRPGPEMKALAAFFLFMSPTIVWQGVIHAPILARAKLVKIEAQEGICSVHEFTVAVTIYVGAIAAVQEIFVMGPSYFIAFEDQEQSAEQGTRVFLTLLAVPTVLAWFWTQVELIVAVSWVPVAIQLPLMNAIFGTSALLGGVMITKSQLDTSIGGWIADINPAFHAISVVYVVIFGGSPGKCEYTSSFFNCGLLNPVTGDPEAIVLGFGMRNTDPDQSFRIVYLYWLGTAAVAILMARRCQRLLLGKPPKWRDDSHAIDTADLTSLIDMQKEMEAYQQQNVHLKQRNAFYKGISDRLALTSAPDNVVCPSLAVPEAQSTDESMTGLLQSRAPSACKSKAISILKPTGSSPKQNRGAIAFATSGHAESSGGTSVV